MIWHFFTEKATRHISKYERNQRNRDQKKTKKKTSTSTSAQASGGTARIPAPRTSTPFCTLLARPNTPARAPGARRLRNAAARSPAAAAAVFTLAARRLALAAGGCPLAARGLALEALLAGAAPPEQVRALPRFKAPEATEAAGATGAGAGVAFRATATLCAEAAAVWLAVAAVAGA